MKNFYKYIFILVLIIFTILTASHFTSNNTATENSISLLLSKAINNFKISPSGVIHIGASDGQEEYIYKKNKLAHVLWIEADPAIAERLAQRLNNTPGTKVASFAASDENGYHEFIHTSNQLSSSLLEPNLNLRKLHPEVIADAEIQVKVQKLDDFLQATHDTSPYNILVLDIQGAELMALRGAVNTLKQIDSIISEIQYDQLYKNSVLVTELDNFLLNHDFLRVDTLSATKAWGDALYVKRKFVTINQS